MPETVVNSLTTSSVGIIGILWKIWLAAHMATIEKITNTKELTSTVAIMKVNR